MAHGWAPDETDLRGSGGGYVLGEARGVLYPTRLAAAGLGKWGYAQSSPVIDTPFFALSIDMGHRGVLSCGRLTTGGGRDARRRHWGTGHIGLLGAAAGGGRACGDGAARGSVSPTGSTPLGSTSSGRWIAPQRNRRLFFGRRLLDLRPDVIDAIARLLSVQRMVEALRGSVQQYVFVGTIWVHGYSTVVPTTEDQQRQPLATMASKAAASRTCWTRRVAIASRPSCTPGASWGRVGPINPAGHRDPAVFEVLARGRSSPCPTLARMLTCTPTTWRRSSSTA